MKNIGIKLIQNKNDEINLDLSADRIKIGDVTHQNLAILLMSQKGEIKAEPAVGIGIDNIIDDNELSEWKREISAQLEADGQIIETLELTSDNLILKSRYK